MHIDAKKKKIVNRHLEKYCPKPPKCSICGKDSWFITDTVYEVRNFLNGTVNLHGGAIIPLVALTCQKCGYTFFLDAISVGIVEEPKKMPSRKPRLKKAAQKEAVNERAKR